MLRRAISNTYLQSKIRTPTMGIFPVRSYRSGFMNPYLHDETPVSATERVEQAEKPVWDRVFDHKKYMMQEGPLKLATGIAFLDVDPFPRMKLMKLYYLTL